MTDTSFLRARVELRRVRVEFLHCGSLSVFESLHCVSVSVDVPHWCGSIDININLEPVQRHHITSALAHVTYRDRRSSLPEGLCARQ